MPRSKTTNTVDCPHCELYPICRVAGLDDVHGSIDKIVQRRAPLKRGEVVIQAGQTEGNAIIAVKSGTLASRIRQGDGTTIIDYHLPGELAGLETISNAKAPYEVIALERASICRISMDALTGLEAHPTLLSLLQTISRYLRQRHWLPRMLSASKAEQRIALFLLGHSERLKLHGLPSGAFRLPLSQLQIAQYLGLAMETVNRTLKQLHAKGLIEIQTRNVVLRDPAGLAELCQILPEELSGHAATEPISRTTLSDGS